MPLNTSPAKADTATFNLDELTLPPGAFAELLVLTKTAAEKSNARRVRLSRYHFPLYAADLMAHPELTDAARIALAVLRGAFWAAKVRRDTWVQIGNRPREAIGRGEQWWRRATRQLEAAGIIEIDRPSGHRCRYRLVQAPTTEAASTPTGTS